MITLRPNRIFIATALTDMRKSFDTLALIVQADLKRDPLSGDAYVFLGRRRNRLKVLWWEESGYWLCAKRLERGTFRPPVSGDDPAQQIHELSPARWQMLLEGLVPLRMKKLPRYSRRAG
jgi:transposase